MHFPTVICDLSYIHAVKDKKHCECGINFNISKRIVLKNIKFKLIEDITCQKCKSALKESLTHYGGMAL